MSRLTKKQTKQNCFYDELFNFWSLESDNVQSLDCGFCPYQPRHRDQPHQEEPGGQRGSAHGAEAARAPGCVGLSGAQHLRHPTLLLHLLRELQEHDWRCAVVRRCLEFNLRLDSPLRAQSAQVRCDGTDTSTKPRTWTHTHTKPSAHIQIVNSMTFVVPNFGKSRLSFNGFFSWPIF